MSPIHILENIGQLATCRAEGGQGEIHLIPDAALVWEGDTIQWVGPRRELSPQHGKAQPVDAGGGLVIPGLIDCHTHLAFAGWRAEEFEQRIQGRSYLEIAEAGGGIAQTVRLTRRASEEDLVARCMAFLGEMRDLGVSTVECKSGYGLDAESELKLLRVYRRLSETQPVRLVPTFLGAHIIPAEYRRNRGAYVDLLVNELIPAVARDRLAVACDVFVEESAFTVEEARRILLAARGVGLATRMHADQLTSGGGAELAAEVGARSADHLECASDRGIAAMAAAGVVAVSLPLATMYLGQPPMPARRFIESGVPVAVATDFNPGSAPSFHLPLALTLACTFQRMTPTEALKGATCIAARALGLEDRLGSLEPGKAADFAAIDATDVNQWVYHFRANACRLSVIRGQVVSQV
jgi:imidazolonepropionase